MFFSGDMHTLLLVLLGITGALAVFLSRDSSLQSAPECVTVAGVASACGIRGKYD